MPPVKQIMKALVDRILANCSMCLPIHTDRKYRFISGVCCGLKGYNCLTDGLRLEKVELYRLFLFFFSPFLLLAEVIHGDFSSNDQSY